MEDLSEKYHERLLHWIWETLHFELTGLQTVSGEPITVLNQGSPNSTDGPDFANAHLRIGELDWHGDIEFHWSPAEWKHHGHHTDPCYNSVVLHVVYNTDTSSDSGCQVRREDGTVPHTLHLRPHLPDDLDNLLSAFHRTDQLPCAGQINYISQEAVRQQFKKAHKEYFNTKTDALLNFYDPDLPPFRAWQRALSLGLFDGLGISHNRAPMLEVGRQLFDQLEESPTNISSCASLQDLALRLGGFRNKSIPTHISWNLKGCRPTNRPELRLQQGAILMWQIREMPFKQWHTQAPEDLWNRLLESIDTETGIGRQRGDILFGIVLLPGLWLLGNLFHIPRLKQTAFDSWMSHHAQLPASLFDLFERAGISPKLYKKKLGAVYQLKHYCKPRRCNRCKVLKEIISS